MIKIIDTDNYAASGIETFFFHGGEPHANIPLWESKHALIFAKIRTWNDFGKLLVVINALRYQNVEISLFMPYFPAMRQDRNPQGLTPLTVEVYAQCIWGVEKVFVCDPHSVEAVEVAGRDFNTIIEFDPYSVLLQYVKQKPTFILAPDKGSYARAQRAADVFGGIDIFYCDKVRDFQSGEIVRTLVPQLPSGHGLLVDDICDGGSTFNRIIRNVVERMPNVSLDLYVTHGIFSKGIEPLKLFNDVYTTDSFFKDVGQYHQVTTIPLLKHFKERYGYV